MIPSLLHWRQSHSGFSLNILWRATARLGDLATSQANDMQELLTAARNNASAAANQAETAAQQHAALREQARATADIVAATKAANDLTNRIFFADQRPWVSIQEISISPTANKGQWEFDVVVSNTGGSPAHYVRASILKIKEGEGPNDVMVSELSKNKNVRRAISVTVFPHERRNFTLYLSDKDGGFHMKPFVIVVEYGFAAAETEHITGGTIFCSRYGSTITYKRTPLSDFAT